jgi:type IV fimbrial biogenesis protein FimT
LVELIVTLAVGAVLMAIALPSFRNLTMSMQTTQAANQLIHDLNLARAEAVRRGTPVEVVSAGGGATWSGGWQVIADSGFNNFASGTVQVAQQGSVPATYGVCGATTGGASAGIVVFSPVGALAGGATAFDANVNRPDGSTSQGIRISVQGSGEVRSKYNTAGSPASQNSGCS